MKSYILIVLIVLVLLVTGLCKHKGWFPFKKYKAASKLKEQVTIKKMNKKNKNAILSVVKEALNEKGLDRVLIIEALEETMSVVAANQYDEDVNIFVKINPQTGECHAFRYWEIVADDADKMSREKKIKLSKAVTRYNDSSLKVGARVEEEVEMATVDFAALQVKSIFENKITEAKNKQIMVEYGSRLGELLSGSIKSITRSSIIINLGNTEALLPRKNCCKGDRFKQGDRVSVLLQAIGEETSGLQIIVTRASPQFLVALLKKEVPELEEGLIEIVSVARDPGRRAIIAVKTNDTNIDPVGACVGARGSRVKVVSNEINCEQVDIILWDDNPVQYVINAMRPAEITSVVVDESNHQMDVVIAEDQLSIAIGKSGQNVYLVSDLTGWSLNVLSEEDAAKQH